MNLNVNKLKEHYERKDHGTVLIYSADVAYCSCDKKHKLFL